MVRKIFTGIGSVVLFIGIAVFAFAYSVERFSDTEAGFDDVTVVERIELDVGESLQQWERPEGPLRVGIQVGHWKLEEVPDELMGLRRTSGAVGGGKKEWEVALTIAQAMKPLLEDKGIIVDVLPATIPPKYFADVFIAIHADGSPSASISGFKAAAPRRDATGKAQKLVMFLNEEYPKTTNIKRDTNITRRMTGYYAFNWRRYEHSIHPMTVGVIMETGFLTSPADQQILIYNPERAAQGMANAIFRFFDLQA